MNLNLAGNEKYIIGVKTDSKPESGTKSYAYIQLIGVNGKSPIKVIVKFIHVIFFKFFNISL